MKVLFLYPHPMSNEISQVLRGQAPSDRMYGLIELRKCEYEVDFSDRRFEGFFGKLVNWLRRNVGINLCDIKTLLTIKNYDLIIVKDEVSTLITIACRLFRKKIIYLDALFAFPRRTWKKIIYKINLRLADGIVAYSSNQIRTWDNLFTGISHKFKLLTYTIDVPFYRAIPCHRKSSKPYILSVGRDMGRDFGTLVESMDGLELGLKLVTLPYALRSVNISHSWVEVLKHVPYQDLFRLYAEAVLVVIPLKKSLIYPSGIRGLLEAMVLGKAVVCSYSPLLEEYVKEGDGVVYVEPENIVALRDKLRHLLGDSDWLHILENRGRDIVRDNYHMDIYAKAFEAYISGLTGANGRQPGVF